MAWRRVSDGELQREWLHSDRQRIEQGFVAGVKIPGTGRRADIGLWLNGQDADWRVSYCGNAPPYHTYWFRTPDAAGRFLSRWDGKPAQAGEGFTRF